MEPISLEVALVPLTLTLDDDGLTVDVVGVVERLAVVAVAVSPGQVHDLEVCVVLVDRAGVQRRLLVRAVPLEGDGGRAPHPADQQQMVSLRKVGWVGDDGQSGLRQRL